MDIDDAIVFEDAAAWESWLADHHDLQEGAWLKIAKKGSGQVSVSNDDAVDVAMCYGWIPGHRKSFDEAFFLQKFTPRRRRSMWSQVSVEMAEALIAAGRMRAPGFAEIEAAKADGRWDAAYVSQKNATVPPDLEAALKDSPRAGEFFDTLGKTDRYTVILQLERARSAATRASRLEKMIAQLAEGRKI